MDVKPCFRVFAFPIQLGMIQLQIFAVLFVDGFVIFVASQCPENVNGTVTYPATAVGNSTTVPCPSGYSGNHVRACSPAGVWEAPTGECGILFFVSCNVKFLLHQLVVLLIQPVVIIGLPKRMVRKLNHLVFLDLVEQQLVYVQTVFGVKSIQRTVVTVFEDLLFRTTNVS